MVRNPVSITTFMSPMLFSTFVIVLIADALARVRRETHVFGEAMQARGARDAEMSAVGVLDGSELLDFLSVSRCSASGNDGCEEVRRRGNCGSRGRELPFFPVWQRSDRRYDGLTATIPMDVEEAIRDVAREGCVGDEIST